MPGTRRIVRKKGFSRARGRKLNKREINEVKRIAGMKIETKYRTLVTLNGVVPAVGMTPSALTSISQGITDSQRVGDTISLKRVEMRYTVNVAGITPDLTNIVRVILFQWYESTIPAITDVLDASIAIGYQSPYNHDQRNLYKIMYDKVHPLAGPAPGGMTTPGGLGSQAVVVKYLSNFGRKRVQYIATTTTASNALWAVAVSDSATSPNPTINMVTKVTYSDS